MSEIVGAIRVHIAVEDGKVVSQTRSSRKNIVGAAIAGQSVFSTLPLTLLGSVYSLCPQAHQAAFLSALSAAMGKDAGDFTELVTLENCAEQLRFLAFDAPRALGIATDAKLSSLGNLRALIAKETNKADPDFVSVYRSLRAALEYFITGCPLENFAALRSTDDFLYWTRSGRTAAARLFDVLTADVPLRGTVTTAPLVPKDIGEAASWFTEEFSPQFPLAAGTPRFTGARVRQAADPLVTVVDGCGPASVHSFYVAALIELIKLTNRRAPETPVIRSGSPESGVGIALVECSRGILTHRVVLSDKAEKIERLDIVAPTEWNFAPGGAAEQALNAIPFTDKASYTESAAWAVNALNACVPYEMTFEEPSHA